MPWLPELFTAPVLQRVLDQRRLERLSSVPYFDGVRSGETNALIGSFGGEPRLHHPQRGLVQGVAGFEAFVAGMNAWMVERNATVEDVDLIVTPRRGVEEVLVRFDGEHGRTELPIALAADRDDDARIAELRVYFSDWPLSGRHVIRPPVLQPDPGLEEPDVVGDYQRALAAGDADATVATFGPDGYVREPAGSAYVHRGTEELRTLYSRFFSNGGGIPLEPCAVTDDGRACALEYNVVAWGRTRLPAQAGIAVYVRGDGGRLAAARIYDDVDPPV